MASWTKVILFFNFCTIRFLCVLFIHPLHSMIIVKSYIAFQNCFFHFIGRGDHLELVSLLKAPKKRQIQLELGLKSSSLQITHYGEHNM